MKTLSDLRAFVREHAANRPGVYRMLGARDEILYVGKSIKLRTRLLSYFRAPDGEKAYDLIRQTRAVRWDLIPNEFGALVREMKLIQNWRPRFNVQHRRKRPYAFVRVTSEVAPRLMPVRRVVEDGSVYYGPFPAQSRLADAVRDLTQVLGLRDCAGPTPMFFNDQTELFPPNRDPRCVRAELGTCSYPCAGGTSSQGYGSRLVRARAFLEAWDTGPVDELEAKMRAAASECRFEYAARLRDRAERLREFQEHLIAFRGRVDSLSFVYRVPGWEGDERLYFIRKGRIRAELPWRKGSRDRVAAREAVREVFNSPDLAPAALEPDEAAEVLLIARWFRLHPAERARTIRPRRWLAEERPPPGSVVRARSGPPRAASLGVSESTRDRSAAAPLHDSVELALAHGLDGEA